MEDPRPWLHLHIGMSKTGSTAIQDFLARNRDWLFRRGFVYPLDGFAINQRHWAKLLTRRGRPLDLSPAARRWRRVLAPQLALGGGRDAILSWEHLLRVGQMRARGARADLLRACFAGHRLHVVAYLRPQDEWLEAMHNQRVKTGRETRPLDDYVADHLAHPLRLRPSLRFWERHVGAERMSVRVFARQRLHGGDAVDDFLHLLDLRRGMGTRPPRRENPRLSPWALEQKRRINTLHLPRRINLAVRDLLLAVQGDPNPAPPSHLRPEHREALRALYAPQNRWWGKRYLGNPDPFGVLDLESDGAR